VLDVLGNEHFAAIMRGEARSASDLYVRHILEVERDQGLNTGPYLPWNAQPSWTEWVRPFYGVLETHVAEQGPYEGAATGMGVEPAPAPEMLSRDALGKLTSQDDFLLAWFDRTLHRAGSGRSASPKERALMEEVHGPLPKGMKIHEGAAAKEAAEGVQAKAFTLGTDIYFADNVNPKTPEGAELLVHEATHVKQAVEGRLPSKKGDGLETSSPSDPHELEAYAAGAEGRDLVANKAAWGLDAPGEIDPAGGAILDKLGGALPEFEGWSEAQEEAERKQAKAEAPQSDIVHRASGTITVDGEEITDEVYLELLEKQIVGIADAGGKTAGKDIVWEIHQQVFNHFHENGSGWDNLLAAPPSDILIATLEKASELSLVKLYGLPEEKVDSAAVSKFPDAIAEFRMQPEVMLSRLDSMGDRLQMFHDAHSGESIMEFWVVNITESIGNTTLPGADVRSDAYAMVQEFNNLMGAGNDRIEDGDSLQSVAEACKLAEDKANIYITAGNDYIDRFVGSNEDIVTVLVFTKGASFTIVTAYLTGGQSAFVKGAGAVGAVALDNVITQTTEVAVGLRADFSLGELANVIAKEGLAQVVGGAAGGALAARLGPHVAGRFAGIVAEGHMPIVTEGITTILKGSFSGGFKSIFKDAWSYWGEGEDLSTSEFLMKTAVAMLAGGVESGLSWDAGTNSLLRNDPEALAEALRLIRTTSNLGKFIIKDLGSSFLSTDDPVQQKAAPGTRSDQRNVGTIARAGLSGARSKLPHADTIQPAFGSHDVSHIQAGVGGTAGQAAADIGAKAYASGDKVAFRSGETDLHTAAHEAAHVVQQRSGKVPDGMGQAGDHFEQHADAVADKVVAGESAEPLLDEMGGGGATGSGVQRKAIQRKEGGGSPHSAALAGLSAGLTATSAAGTASMGKQSAGNPALGKQNATEDRDAKVDRFQDGVDFNLDELEDYKAFDDLIEAIDDDESTSGPISRLQRTEEFKQLAQQWQSAKEDEKDGAKMRGLFNYEYDGRGFWAETEKAFELVATAAKRAATPEPSAAGAKAALSKIDGAEEVAPGEGEKGESGEIKGGKKGGGVGPPAIPEAIAALLGVAVSPELEPLASYDQLESLQDQFGEIHLAHTSRETVAEESKAPAEERSRFSEVFETLTTNAKDGFLTGLYDGAFDALVWDTITDKADDWLVGATNGSMKKVGFVGAGFTLYQSFFSGEEVDWTAGIGGETGDLAKMGGTADRFMQMHTMLASGECSTKDVIGLMLGQLVEVLQMCKQVLDLISKVLGILSALLYVIAGVLILLGICFSWCGMAWLIPIGQSLLTPAAALQNVCKILAPITMALSLAVLALRPIVALMIPQEMYKDQLNLSGEAMFEMAKTTGETTADQGVSNIKNDVLVRTAKDDAEKENLAAAKQTEGDAEGKKDGDDLSSNTKEGEAEFYKRIEESKNNQADDSPESGSNPSKKGKFDKTKNTVKSILNYKNYTKAFTSTWAPLKKLKDPAYWNATELRVSLEKSNQIHLAEVDNETHKKLLEKDISGLEKAIKTHDEKIPDLEKVLDYQMLELNKSRMELERANKEGSGATKEDIKEMKKSKNELISIVEFAEKNLNETTAIRDDNAAQLSKREKQLKKQKDSPNDRSGIELGDQKIAKKQLDKSLADRNRKKKEFDDAASQLNTALNEKPPPEPVKTDDESAAEFDNRKKDHSTAKAEQTEKIKKFKDKLAKKTKRYEKADHHLDLVRSSPANAKNEVDNDLAVNAATKDVEEKRRAIVELKEEYEDKGLSWFTGKGKLGVAEADLAKSEAKVNKAKNSLDYLRKEERLKQSEDATNKSNREHVIKDEDGKEVAKRHQGPNIKRPKALIDDILGTIFGIEMWSPDFGKTSGEESGAKDAGNKDAAEGADETPKWEGIEGAFDPALGKIYYAVGSEAFSNIMAGGIPIDLDTLREDRESAELHMQQYAAVHLDAYKAYQGELGAQADIDGKKKFLKEELKPTGEIVAAQGPELKSAESTAKERQSKLSGVDPEVGEPGTDIGAAGKAANEGVKEGEDDMKDKPDKGATAAGASDSGESMKDADAATTEGKDLSAAGSEEEVAMMGEMVGIHGQIETTHKGSITSMEAKISEDELILQEIKLEKATRLNEANIERGLADTHATAYNESTITLTDWANKYQEDRATVESLNAST
jgi:hypothetical protein